jgi:hypothetical protein
MPGVVDSGGGRCPASTRSRPTTAAHGFCAGSAKPRRRACPPGAGRAATRGRRPRGPPSACSPICREFRLRTRCRGRGARRRRRGTRRSRGRARRHVLRAASTIAGAKSVEITRPSGSTCRATRKPVLPAPAASSRIVSPGRGVERPQHPLGDFPSPLEHLVGAPNPSGCNHLPRRAARLPVVVELHALDRTSVVWQTRGGEREK